MLGIFDFGRVAITGFKKGIRPALRVAGSATVSVAICYVVDKATRKAVRLITKTQEQEK